MPSIHFLVTVILLMFVGTICYGQTGSGKSNKKKVEANEKVDSMFDSMHRGDYQRSSFVDLSWEDVPALLGKARSHEKLASFPTNLLSSQMQRECVEGIAALWLIEGIRQGGKFPSLNPELKQRESEDSDFEKLNPSQIHNRAVELYAEWWESVSPEPTEESSTIEPLAESGFFWR